MGNFTAVAAMVGAEPAQSGTTATMAFTTHSATLPTVNYVLCSVQTDGLAASSLSGAGCTWSQMSVTNTFSAAFVGTGQIFVGQVTSPGAGTITVNFPSSSSQNVRINAQEFGSASGLLTLDKQSHLDSTGTNTWPTLTPSGTDELYFGYCEDQASSAAGSTSGFVYEIDGNGNATGYCLSVNAAYTPVWGDSSQAAGTMVLVTGAGAVTPGPPGPQPQAWPFYQQRLR
jgi:hypothetical protein